MEREFLAKDTYSMSVIQSNPTVSWSLSMNTRPRGRKRKRKLKIQSSLLLIGWRKSWALQLFNVIWRFRCWVAWFRGKPFSVLSVLTTSTMVRINTSSNAGSTKCTEIVALSIRNHSTILKGNSLVQVAVRKLMSFDWWFSIVIENDEIQQNINYVKIEVWLICFVSPTSSYS